MKNNSILILIPFVLLLCIPLMGPLQQTDGLEALLPIEKTVTLGYTSVSPIVITHNDNFTEQGFLGSGTAGEPYYLDSVEIESDGACISITNTTAYFEITSSFFTSQTGTYIDRKGNGIYLSNVSQFSILNCDFSEKVYAIRPENCDNGTIYNNDFVDNEYAFLGHHTDVLTINENSIGGVSTPPDRGSGIGVSHSNNVSIMDNILDNTLFGISLSYVNDGNVTDNTIHLFEANSGMVIQSCVDVQIEDNKFTGDESLSLLLESSHGCTLKNNIIEGGSLKMLYDYNNTLDNNTVDGLPIIFYYNISDEVIQGDGWGQLIIGDSTNVTVTGSSFTAGGITIGDSEWCTIESNLFHGSYDSIMVVETSNVVISDNELFDVIDDGIYTFHLENTTVVDNLVVSASGMGAYIEGVGNSTVTGNRIFNSGASGMHLSLATINSLTTIIESNFVSGAGSYAMCLSAYNSTISNNTLVGSNIGMTLDGYGNNITGNRLGWNELWNAQEYNWDPIEKDNIWSMNYYSDYNGSGAYDIDGNAGSVDLSPILLTDDSLPFTDALNDLEFESGATPAPLSWDIVEEFPLEYQLLKNDTAIESGPLYMTNIDTEIEGLDPALYNFTLVLTECTGNSTTETVMVQVHPSEGPVIELTILTESPTPEDDVVIQAIVTDISDVANVFLSYSLNNSDTWTNITMTLSGSEYEAAIPQQANGTIVHLKVFAVDVLGNMTVSGILSYSVLDIPTEPTAPLLDEGMLILAGGVGAVVVLGIIIVVAKKR